MADSQRSKILQILYQERGDPLPTLDRDELARLVGKSWPELESDVASLEEKGYVATRKSQIRTHLFHLLSITPKGIALVENRISYHNTSLIKEFLNFDMEVGINRKGMYPVVVHSPAGEARKRITLPFDGAPLEELFHQQTVQSFGQQLFDAFFARDIRRLYQESKQKALDLHQGLRLRLHLQAPDLSILPWEYLYDKQQDQYVCLSRYTPLLRYLDLAQSSQALTVDPPLRILGMIANPTDQDSLDMAHEQEQLHDALKGLEREGLVELTWLPGQTWRDLQQALWEGPWHIFHFIGHGGFDPHRDQGVLAFADETGKTHVLTADQIGRVLANHAALRLALLNACEGARGSQHNLFSSTAAMLARRGIPAVLAMQETISDRAAIELTRTFYGALAAGLAVETALSEARVAMSLALPNTLEWGVPVLYLRTPDGMLFNLAY